MPDRPGEQDQPGAIRIRGLMSGVVHPRQRTLKIPRRKTSYGSRLLSPWRFSGIAISLVGVSEYFTGFTAEQYFPLKVF